MRPMFSIVIPFRGEVGQLRDCLDSLARQAGSPNFDVVVVDDGSENPISGGLVSDYSFPLRVLRQVHLGISAARNAGISRSSGQVVLFVDSDVTLADDCLENLETSVKEFPQDLAFQTNLCGGNGSLVERMEGLRLSATLASLGNGDGHVNYANTSAFAIRRSMLEPGKDLFDVGAVRGEDTKLLADLLERGQRPRLVEGAKAMHRPQMRLFPYIRKHFRIGYYTKPARDELRQVCPDLLLGPAGRRGVARRMFAGASADPANRIALPLSALGYGLRSLADSHTAFWVSGAAGMRFSRCPWMESGKTSWSRESLLVRRRAREGWLRT